MVQAIALFALHGHYYPGPKWLRRTMAELGFDREAVARYDRLWVQPAYSVEQVVALGQLNRWVEDRHRRARSLQRGGSR